MLEAAAIAALIIVGAALVKKARRGASTPSGVTTSDIEDAAAFGGGGAIAGPLGEGIRAHPRIKPIKAPPDWVPALRNLWEGGDVLVRPKLPPPFRAHWSSLDPRLLPAGAQPGDPVCFLVLGSDGHWYFPMIRHEDQIAQLSGRNGGAFVSGEYDPITSTAGGEVIPASELIFTADVTGWFFVCLRPLNHFSAPAEGVDERFGDYDDGRDIANLLRDEGIALGRFGRVQPFRHFGNRIDPVFARWILEGQHGSPPELDYGPQADGAWLSWITRAAGVGYATAEEMRAIGWETTRGTATDATVSVRE